MTIEIKTNNVPRPILYGLELSDKERAEFDYLEGEELDCATFVRYIDRLYHLGDVMRIDARRACLPEGFESWHGYASDGFFSGVLFRFTDCGDGVVCATYSS